jgi:hypothetical protein
MARVPRRAAAVALSVAFAVASPAVAYADATTDAAALREFDAGRAAYERGAFADALASFTASLQALPSPNTRLYIARCQRSLGKIASAHTSFALAAREAADRLNATGEKRFGATRDAAVAEAAEIEKTVPHLTITLPADAPATTAVKLDDVEIPRSALGSLDVDPGAHALHVRAPRHTPFEQKFEIAASEQKTVQVTLKHLPTATVRLAFDPKPAGLAVEIDKQGIEPRTIDEPHEVDVGAHHIVVRAPGYRDFEWSESLADGDVKSVKVHLVPGTQEGSHGTPKWLFFGVAGLSVVTLLGATYFALDATSRASTEKDKDPLVRDPAEQDKIRSDSTTANVLFIAGAAIAGGAGALGFITDWGGSSPKTGKTTPVVVRPFVGVGGVGATGSF